MVLDSGDTAFILVATAMVMLMIPESGYSMVVSFERRTWSR